MAQPGLPYSVAQAGLNQWDVSQSIVQGGFVEVSGVKYPKGRSTRVTEWRGLSKLGATLLSVDLTNQSAPDYEHVISEHRQPGNLWTVRRSIEFDFNHAPLKVAEEGWTFTTSNYSFADPSGALGWPAAASGKNQVYTGAEIVETGTKEHNGTNYRVAKVQVNHHWAGMGFFGAIEWANRLRLTGTYGNPDREFADLIRVEWSGSGLYTVYRTAIIEMDHRPDTPNVIWTFNVNI